MPPRKRVADQLPTAGLLGGFLDPEWYRMRYPDAVSSGLDPYQHFIHFGAAEQRDPNGFFDGAWYAGQNPDVGATGMHPLLHYAQTGAAQLRNPHPRFDATYYVEQHPDAAINPLLYHLRVGAARGYATEKPRADPDAAMRAFLDPAWYLERYPDLAGGDLDPYRHFSRYGAMEKRDPNRFFDSEWYVEHYPDVAASGLAPLLHYVQCGAVELRNPHPKFDAAYYVEQHPDAADNPLLYHLRVGAALGYLTENPIDIRDYLPSAAVALPLPLGVFADVIIRVQDGFDDTVRCLRSVLADRALPLARIIVVEDCRAEPALLTWLLELAVEGQIHLIRNRRRLGLVASAKLGMDAAERHDVVLLSSNTEVPGGWLHRLMAQAYAAPDIATVSPLSDHASVSGYVDDADVTAETSARIDDVCRTVNVGRSAAAASPAGHCVYLRRAALLAVGGFDGLDEFAKRATAAGWRHRLAGDTFVYSGGTDGPRHIIGALQFVVTAALFRASELPVLLMITHNYGGGVRRHIDSLVERYRHTARVLLLEATDRGAALSVPALAGDKVVALAADRVDDLVAVLRSANLSRVHIHHLLLIDMDIRVLVNRLRVPLDVTVHDYYAICPQINLLRWEEGLYCGEPGPAGCNACIAEQSSHGARDIVSWRRDWAWQFLDAARVICPSSDIRARLDRYGVGARAVVVPHEQQMDSVWASRLPEFSAAPLRIVLLGVLANHKGARAVAEVAEAASTGTIELHLVGHLEPTFPKPARRLIKATGRYEERDLPALLRRIDPHVFWFPSSAPETYSFTLSTAIASGLPIVATDIGSFPERLAGRPNTWLVDHRASSVDWLAVFDAVRTTLKKGADPPAVPRAVAVSAFYDDQYLSPAPRLNRSGLAAKPRIAIVPERYGSGGLTPCGYIRLLQPLDHPSIGESFDIVLADAETVFNYDADIIVTQRYAIGEPEAADRLAAHAQRTGAKLLFDLDDDLLDVPVTHPDAVKLRPFEDAVRHMLTVADAVWVSTFGLAERVKLIRGDAVVVENRLDERIWVHEPRTGVLWDDPVRILCMGTTTHDADFAMIEPVLVRLKTEYGDRIVIDILGMTSRSELPAELNRIDAPTQASRSYPGFVHWLTSTQPRWHVGLAPLLDTPFNRSKSPIKAMDYAALGLTVLASDTPVYRGSIADGPAGKLVANDPRVWYADLDWLIRDQRLRASRVTRAREAFVAAATLAGHADIRLAALRGLLRDRSRKSDAGLRERAAELSIEDGKTDPATRKRRHRG